MLKNILRSYIKFGLAVYNGASEVMWQPMAMLLIKLYAEVTGNHVSAYAAQMMMKAIKDRQWAPSDCLRNQICWTVEQIIKQTDMEQQFWDFGFKGLRQFKLVIYVKVNSAEYRGLLEQVSAQMVQELDQALMNGVN